LLQQDNEPGRGGALQRGAGQEVQLGRSRLGVGTTLDPASPGPRHVVQVPRQTNTRISTDTNKRQRKTAQSRIILLIQWTYLKTSILIVFTFCCHKLGFMLHTNSQQVYDIGTLFFHCRNVQFDSFVSVCWLPQCCCCWGEGGKVPRRYPVPRQRSVAYYQPYYQVPLASEHGAAGGGTDLPVQRGGCPQRCYTYIYIYIVTRIGP
jgi:hypothetical protein